MLSTPESIHWLLVGVLSLFVAGCVAVAFAVLIASLADFDDFSGAFFMGGLPLLVLSAVIMLRVVWKHDDPDLHDMAVSLAAGVELLSLTAIILFLGILLLHRLDVETEAAVTWGSLLYVVFALALAVVWIGNLPL